jgi:hypothetical protein
MKILRFALHAGVWVASITGLVVGAIIMAMVRGCQIKA